jgi:predicted HAD superfamily phosphohydrolase YqeG
VGGVRAAYRRAGNLDGLLAEAGKLAAKALVFDVEPLIAYWGNDQEALERGVAKVLEKAATVPGVTVVCFATNSARRPAAVPSHPGLQVVYLASAGKPVRTTPYAGFPRPGAVIGDQVATDGLLAWRLGYAFLQYWPAWSGAPWGPRLLNYGGRVLRPLLFTGS